MDTTESTPKSPNKSPKRNSLFWIGIVAGILLGAAMMLFAMDWLNFRRPKEVQVIQTLKPENSSDTVVNLVIHRHEKVYEEPKNQSVDSLVIDSLSDDATQDLYLDEADISSLKNDVEAEVFVDKMISKVTQKVSYLDPSKKEIATPENAVTHIQIQFWNTPVKNRITYQFNGSVLKIKGLNPQSVKITHWKNNFYMECGKRLFLLKNNTQFERLVETME